MARELIFCYCLEVVYIGRMFDRKQVMRLYAEAECKVKSRKKVNCIAQTPGSESMLSALKANY